MRTAEVEITKQITFRANDKERREFKIQCIKEGQEMAVVLRQFIRDYVKEHQK